MNQNPVRPRHRTSPDQHGFTLVEIMVVIVILGLLGTIVTQNVIKSLEKSRLQKAETDCKAIAEAIKMWQIQNSKGKLPTIEELTTPDDKGHAYLDTYSKDPWDNDYMIKEGQTRNQFEVISWGPDGQEGTEDDISSRPKEKQ